MGNGDSNGEGCNHERSHAPGLSHAPEQRECAPPASSPHQTTAPAAAAGPAPQPRAARRPAAACAATQSQLPRGSGLQEAAGRGTAAAAASWASRHACARLAQAAGMLAAASDTRPLRCGCAPAAWTWRTRQNTGSHQEAISKPSVSNSTQVWSDGRFRVCVVSRDTPGAVKLPNDALGEHCHCYAAVKCSHSA